MTLRLIITRHGETVENQQGIITGHMEGSLSSEGKEQAGKLAERLKDEDISAIYSSDLKRAADTAEEVAKLHPGVPVKLTKELRERYLGEFEGKKKADVGWDKQSVVNSLPSQPRDGETIEEVYTRAKTFLDKILKEHKRGTVLIVGHNGICKSVIAVIEGKSASEVWHSRNLGNTSISIFEFDWKVGHRGHTFNCKKHLE